MIASGPQIPAGHAWTSYYTAGGSRVAMRVKSNQDGVEDGVYYFLSDHLGSTAITLDPTGNLVSELRYSAWGETRTSTGVTPMQRRYTGQLEAEAGLYFYNARWFDPSLGRFAQSDSIISQPGNPLAWDRYGYVGNNPINRIDPSGHADIDSDGVGTPFSILIQLLHDIYDWNLSSEFNEGQVSIIRDSAWKIRDYLSDLRNSDDMYLMKKLFGGIMFRYNTELNQFLKSSVGPSAESVHLYKDFERLGWKPKGSVGMVIHELGHVLDNRMGLETPRIIYCTQYYCEASPAVIDGGGPADSLVDYIGGTQSWPYRFLGFTYIPPMFRFQGDFEYGNNSSADYFAQAFMANVLGNGSPYVTSLWMESYLRLLQ